MSSQEEYLDRLLKNLGAENINTEEIAQSAETSVQPNKIFVDDSSSVAEENVYEEFAEDAVETTIETVSETVNEIAAEVVNETASEMVMEPEPEVALESEIVEPKVEGIQENDILSGLAELMNEAEFSDLEDDDALFSGDLGFMSEEEVEQALRTSSMEQEEGFETPDEQELYNLLDNDSGDDSVHIKDMLERDEQNLAVDAGILELLQSNFEDEEPALFDDEQETTENSSSEGENTEKRMNAAEKKALRDSRIAQKREKRELKRQEKLAKKEARKQAKNSQVSQNEDTDTMLPHVDIDAVNYTEVQGAMDALQGVGFADLNDLQNYATADIDTVQDIAAVDMEALQGIELADLGLTGADFVDLQAVQMNDADATADALFQQLSEDGMMADLFSMSEEAAIASDFDVSAQSNGKNKEKRNNKSKNKSIFTRFMDFITEEEEDEDSSKGNENLSISDENKAILQEMDALPAKKKKKGKTPEELEEQKKKKEEKQKAKLEKKAKKANAQETVQIQQPPLSRKKVSAVVILGISACVIIVIICAVMIEYMSKREGRQAYYDQDYETCYQNFFGKELDESEQIMFHRSEMILKMRLWIREYEILAEEGSEMEALDSLIQSVHEYPALFDYSNQWNAGADVQAIYNELLTILDSKYHVSEEEARSIANIKEDVEYTRAVKAIVDGMSYQEWLNSKDQNGQSSAGGTTSGGQNTAKDEQDVPVLPEEEEMGNIEFIDNM